MRPKFNLPAPDKPWVWELVLAEGCDPQYIRALRKIVDQAVLDSMPLTPQHYGDGALSTAVRAALGKGKQKRRSKGRGRTADAEMADNSGADGTGASKRPGAKAGPGKKPRQRC